MCIHIYLLLDIKTVTKVANNRQDYISTSFESVWHLLLLASFFMFFNVFLNVSLKLCMHSGDVTSMESVWRW